MFEFEKTGKEQFGAGGICRLYVNNEKVGEGDLPKTVRFIYSLDETFDIGMDTGTPVTTEYSAGVRFTGKIKKVQIDLLRERHLDHDTESKLAMTRQ